MPPSPEDLTLEKLQRWDRAHVWHAFTQMAEYEPFIIERARGCTLVDTEGREYLDGVSSLWCNVHGHRHPRLDAALREQLDRVAHVTSLGASNPTTIQLAKRLVDVSPEGLEHVFFSSDGSCAVEVAIKMSLQYWRQKPSPQNDKTLFLALGDAYHGDTLGSVSVGGVARFHAMFEPLLFEVLRLPTPNAQRPPAGCEDDAGLTYHVAQLEAVLQEHHSRIAAMVIEPMVQCAAGMVMHPPGYLRAVRALTRKYDVHLIADEVAVGMGRTGRLFACEHEGVSPDFVCLGKGLTGGYLPMSATLTSTEAWNAFLGEYADSKQFFHGHTFGGNPLCAAVALATLDVFEEEQTLAKLPARIARIAEQLAPLREHRHVGNVRQCGMIAAVDLVQSRTTNEPFPWEEKRGLQVCHEALKAGVWLRPLGNIVVVMPPLAVAENEIDRICQAVCQGVAAATATTIAK